MLKFDKFCKLILNEDVGEDIEDLNEEPGNDLSSTGPTDLDGVSSPDVGDDLGQEVPTDFSADDSFETRVGKIKAAFPTMPEKDVERLAKNDIGYTTWIEPFLNTIKNLKSDLNPQILEPLTPDLESDLPDETDVEDIKPGLADYEDQKGLEAEDEESMLGNDQNI